MSASRRARPVDLQYTGAKPAGEKLGFGRKDKGLMRA